MATSGGSVSQRADDAPSDAGDGHQDQSSTGMLTAAAQQTTKDQLLDCLASHKAVGIAAQMPLPEEEDAEKLIEILEARHAELHSLVTDLAQRETMLRRLQSSNTLMETMYPNEGVSEQEDQAEREELKSLLLEQTGLVSQILAEHKEMEEMKPRLEATMKKKFELTNENRKLMSVLKERQTAQTDKADTFKDDAEIQEARERVQKLIWRTELERHTLQGLILGSGVNWAQDEELMETMLSLGTPVDG